MTDVVADPTRRKHGWQPDPYRNPDGTPIGGEPVDSPAGRYTCRCGENCYNATELDAHIYYAPKCVQGCHGDVHRHPCPAAAEIEEAEYEAREVGA